MRRLNWILALSTIATLAAAQSDTVRIAFPEAAERQVWTGEASAFTGQSSIQATGDAIEVSRPQASESVFVYEVSNGNVFARSAEELGESEVWEFSGQQPAYAYKVTVKVEHAGEAVANGIVRIEFGDEERTSLLGPGDEGLAEFFLVPFGDVDVEFEYDFEGEDRTTSTQIFMLEETRSQPIPVFTISVPDSVETLAQEGSETDGAGQQSSDESEGGAAADSDSRGSPVSRILGFLVALAIVGGAIYFAYRFMTQNPDKVKEGLTKLGIDPGSPDTDPSGVQAPAPPQKAEVKPIVLEDSEPGAATASPASPATPAAPAGPALVGDLGRLELKDGLNSVGREGAVDVIVSDETVSRNHAEIVLEDDTTMLRDLDSTNGTYVNGQKLVGDTVLKPGDSVQFGKVMFRFER